MAPQNATRQVPFQTLAPPTCAETASSPARNKSEAIVTEMIRCAVGAASTMPIGSAAPTEKLAAEASAAWVGRGEWNIRAAGVLARQRSLGLAKSDAIADQQHFPSEGHGLDRRTPHHALTAAIASGTEPAKMNTRSPGMRIHSSVRAVLVPVYSRLRACQ